MTFALVGYFLKLAFVCVFFRTGCSSIRAD